MPPLVYTRKGNNQGPMQVSNHQENGKKETTKLFLDLDKITFPELLQKSFAQRCRTPLDDGAGSL